MSAIGVDGCKKGWFAIRLEPSGASSANVYSTIVDLWDEWSDASLILIDIPIGLSETKRQCDKDARHALGRRHPTVFTPPCREALRHDAHKEGSTVNRQVTGRGLSKQAWAIAPKIKEVDELMRQDPRARSTIREVHPEVCFWAFAGEPMPHNKKKAVGWQERLDLLRKLDQRTDSMVDAALRGYLRKDVAKDDILDALVAALTADGDIAELRSFPAEPQRDAEGLLMEMVYRRSRGAKPQTYR